MRETSTKPRLLVLSTALAVALLLAALAALAFEAQAGLAKPKHPNHHPPKTVLMKGAMALQSGSRLTTCWTYWEKRGWTGYCADYWTYYFPKVDTVRVGTRLHIRIAKPEHPVFEFTTLDAYPRVKNAAPSGPGPGKLLKGERKELGRTFRPVKKNGETVAWNVFFRVNEPDRDYYIDFYPEWNRIPGAHSSYGDAEYAFHVRTR